MYKAVATVRLPGNWMESAAITGTTAARRTRVSKLARVTVSFSYHYRQRGSLFSPPARSRACGCSHGGQKRPGATTEPRPRQPGSRTLPRRRGRRAPTVRPPRRPERLARRTATPPESPSTHTEYHHHYRVDYEQDPHERRHRARPTQAPKEGEVVADERRGPPSDRPGRAEGEVARERRQEPLGELQQEDAARQPTVWTRAPVEIYGRRVDPTGVHKESPSTLVVAGSVEAKGYGTYKVACSDQESVP